MKVSNLFFILALIFFVSGLVMLVFSKESIINTKCYDKYDNVIVDQTCLEDINSNTDIIILSSLMVLIFGTFGIICKSFEDLNQ